MDVRVFGLLMVAAYPLFFGAVRGDREPAPEP